MAPGDGMGAPAGVSIMTYSTLSRRPAEGYISGASGRVSKDPRFK
jgi:hypothetical protein